MSTLIKELAKRAYENMIETTPSFLVTKEIFEQKFAELIILECDRYARSTWEHGHLLGGDLKRLFGLEE